MSRRTAYHGGAFRPPHGGAGFLDAKPFVASDDSAQQFTYDVSHADADAGRSAYFLCGEELEDA